MQVLSSTKTRLKQGLGGGAMQQELGVGRNKWRCTMGEGGARTQG